MIVGILHVMLVLWNSAFLILRKYLWYTVKLTKELKLIQIAHKLVLLNSFSTLSKSDRSLSQLLVTLMMLKTTTYNLINLNNWSLSACNVLQDSELVYEVEVAGPPLCMALYNGDGGKPIYQLALCLLHTYIFIFYFVI